MKMRTKRFFVDGLLVISIIMIIGSAWFVATMPEPVWKKLVFFCLSGPFVFYTALNFYRSLIKNNEYKLMQGIYCELESFFDFEQPRQKFFDEALERLNSIGDVTFITSKPVEQSKSMLARLTNEKYPIIPIDSLAGKKVEILVSKRTADVMKLYNIGYNYFVAIKEKEAG
jgi:hypothetical protein